MSAREESGRALETVAECDERIAEALYVLERPAEYDVEVRVQADKDQRRWLRTRQFAERIAALEASPERAAGIIEQFHCACEHAGPALCGRCEALAALRSQEPA